MNRPTMPSQFREFLPWIVPLILLLAYHAPVILGGWVRVEPVYGWTLYEPSAYVHVKSFNQDVAQAMFPYWLFKHQVVRSGESWEWTPYQFSGSPLWAEGILAVGSVTHLLTLPLQGVASYTAGQVLLGLLMILFANLLLREWGLEPLGRTLAVTTFVLCKESIVHQQYQYYELMAWWLAAAWTLVRSCKSHSRWGWLTWGLLGGIFWGAGLYSLHSLMQAMALATLAVLAFFLAFYPPGRESSGFGWRVAGTYIAMVVVGLGLGAAQWLPTLELMSYSYRTVTPKGLFLPPSLRFMPYAFPNDQDLRAALEMWFGFRSLSYGLDSFIPWPWTFDGHYLAPTAFGLIALIFLDRETRRLSRPLWLSFLTVVGGYNLLAIAAQVGAIRAVLTRWSLLQSVNLNSIVAFATLFLWLLAGFGLSAFWRLSRSRPLLLRRVLIVGVVLLIAYSALGLAWSAHVRGIVVEDLETFRADAGRWEKPIVDAVQSQAEELAARWRPAPWPVLATTGLLFVDLGLLWLGKRRQRLQSWAAVGLSLTMAASGLLAQWDRLALTAADKLLPPSAAIEFLQRQTEPTRFWVVDDPRSIEERLADFDDPGEMLGLGRFVQLDERPVMPALSLIYRLEDMRGVAAMNLRDYRVLLQGVRVLPEGAAFVEPVLSSEVLGNLPAYQRSLDLLNARYILSPLELDEPRYRLVLDGPLKVYENPGARPRVWFTGKAQVISDRKKLLLEMCAPNWDVSEVLLERPVGVVGPVARTRYGFHSQDLVLLPGGSLDWVETRSWMARWWTPQVVEAPGGWSADPAASAEINWIERSSGRFVVDVDANGRGWLMWSEVWFPGWQCTVDGAPWDIYRADYALMAIPLEPGRHRVELFYRSESRRAGFWISLATLGLVSLSGLYLLALHRRGRQSRDTVDCV
jgi:hypothetical protein